MSKDFFFKNNVLFLKKKITEDECYIVIEIDY